MLKNPPFTHLKNAHKKFNLIKNSEQSVKLRECLQMKSHNEKLFNNSKHQDFKFTPSIFKRNFFISTPHEYPPIVLSAVITR